MAMDNFSNKSWVRFFAVIATLSVTVSLLFVLRTKDEPFSASDIRVKNETGIELLGVRVNGVAYGNLPIGALTRYQTQARAYRYADLEVEMLGMKIRIRPDDYTPEQPLGKGQFTYKIQNRNSPGNSIDIQAVRDLD